MKTRIEIQGLEDVTRRMRLFPNKYRDAVSVAMDAALLQVWESVPPYPVYSSSYDRTGTLGRSLGVGRSGERMGLPDVLEKRFGANYVEGNFGSNLDYAPYVIGEGSQAGHMGHWWTFANIRRDAVPKIRKTFTTLRDELVRYLAGKGMF